MSCGTPQSGGPRADFGLEAALQTVRFAGKSANITKSAALPAQEYCDGI